MMIRANSVCRGTSAIRPRRRLLEHLRRDILPLIPERGSLGASGDLVPLCYVAAALIGEGDVCHHGRVRPALDALLDEGLDPVLLEPKEGLALINGTSFTAGCAVLAVWDAREIALLAELATAMTSRRCRATRPPSTRSSTRNKPHPGQVASAAHVRALLDGSRLATSFEQILIRRERLDDRGYVQLTEATASRTSTRSAAPRRSSACCATPSTGSTAGSRSRSTPPPTTRCSTPPTAACTSAATSTPGTSARRWTASRPPPRTSPTCSTASSSSSSTRSSTRACRRTSSPATADDPQAGLHHGFKGMQIAASAITAEALKQTMPASVFSRSTEAHNQDKVSMGAIAARDARTVNGLSARSPRSTCSPSARRSTCAALDVASPAVRAVHALIREQAPFVDGDRRLDRDIAAVLSMIRTGTLSALAARLGDRRGRPPCPRTPDRRPRRTERT